MYASHGFKAYDTSSPNNGYSTGLQIPVQLVRVVICRDSLDEKSQNFDSACLEVIPHCG
jgi:hypothetical protein